jgi:penicillin amidase
VIRGRWTLRLLAAAAVAVATAAAAIVAVQAISFYAWVGDRRPEPNGQVTAPQLERSVRISRDAFGVPHVQAESAAEAFTGLGFAHAQDRLWQLELLRRSARGRLSELFGEDALPADRLARTLGLHEAAEQEWSALRPSTRKVLQAYSDGVNLWIQAVLDRRVAVPFEFDWLGVEPELWTPQDSLMLVRFRAWLLGRSLSLTLLLDRLVRDLGGVASQDFFPVPPPAPDTDRVGKMLEIGRAADALARVAGLHGRVGSIGFVVGRQRSRSGHALLANDPHVELRLPNLFYMAHLSTPEWEVAGATWPGMPIFWAGTNRSIAWGQVTLHASVSDLFDESLHPEDRSRYDWGGRWRQGRRREEIIRVRDGADQQIEVISTRHGPLLAPVDPDAQTYALRWTGQSQESGFEALLRVQDARSWKSFREALRGVPAPAATFLYADRHGNIGTQVAGRLPIRTIDTGLLPVPGRSSFYDWRGFIPFDRLPTSFGRDEPWLVASTSMPRTAFPEAVAWLRDGSGGGESRLRRALRRSGELSLDDVIRIQRERHSAQGTAAVRQLVEGLDLPEGPAALMRQALLDWDGETRTGSVGAAIFHVFRRRLTERLLEDRLGAPYIEDVLSAAEPVPGVLLSRFLERVGPPRSRSMIERSLEETWSWFGVNVSSNPDKWTWGRVHRLRLRHAFEELGGPVLQRLGRSLGRGPFPAPGNADSVWTMYHSAKPPFEAMVGPALRVALDMADPDHLTFGLCGGQSGHPGDPLYDDGVADWLAGRPRPLWMHPLDVTYHERGVWELQPPTR